MSIQSPLALEPLRVADETYLFGSWVPVPTLGLLPVNSFLIRAAQPVLVDTGLAGLRADFLKHLGALLDPKDLRWIWVTHMDADHVGNLAAVLELAPQARVVTSFIGVAKMGLLGLPQERAYLLNPGQKLDVGDRELLAAAPPVFDAPETAGLLDTRTRALFCADCFGAVQPEMTTWANEVQERDLARGMGVWAQADAPWLQMVDPNLFRQRIKAYEALGADLVLGSHLQPARGMGAVLSRSAEEVLTRPAFVGPDQAEMERLMAAAAA